MYAGTFHPVTYGSGKVVLSVLMGGKDGYPAPMWKRQGDGQVFIAGEPMTPFALHVSNGLRESILVVPAIDHRAVLEDKPASASGKGMIIPALGDYTFDGWRKDNATTLPFVFTLPEESVAVQAAVRDQSRPVTGVIGFALYRQRQYAPPLALRTHDGYGYEGMTKGASGGSSWSSTTKGVAVSAPGPVSSDLGTGIGRTQQFSPVTDGHFERHAPSLVLAKILYASENALREQGLLSMPEPEAFPGGEGFTNYKTV